ncbi:hypothetical protein FNV43_RR19861 [Rhamnella rubrinervis]|uniref:ATPase AAA-type core domain-containing protein n=1 Tax=Rhamnella rubrinervis TaxID=2594499 RepID=A0A8K0DXM8_9ROSA|nr:hypothetical protein FNV43_RR19861 [Rhamnella rubrinervis]
MIAAIGNLLNYDVYDLELTAVKDNTELRRLLIETTGKSIIVIEDIDCSLDLTGQRKKAAEETTSCLEDEKMSKKEEGNNNSNSIVTLSGLLNFIDGLWSSCGGERIIVFTTNYVENLDPALIRRGRMDKHIELSYCKFEGFKVLAKNYLKLETHQMLDEIETLMGRTKITPADVVEFLMPKRSEKTPVLLVYWVALYYCHWLTTMWIINPRRLSTKQLNQQGRRFHAAQQKESTDTERYRNNDRLGNVSGDGEPQHRLRVAAAVRAHDLRNGNQF